MKHAILWLCIFCTTSVAAQIVRNHSKDSLGGYKIILDKNRNLLSWYKPEMPGAAYGHVMKLASEFIKNETPTDPKTGLKLYFVSCCFDGPHLSGETAFRQGKSTLDWLHNPACVFAGMTQSLAIAYRDYSGDSSYLQTVREMLDYQLTNGTTPGDGQKYPLRVPILWLSNTGEVIIGAMAGEMDPTEPNLTKLESWGMPI